MKSYKSKIRILPIIISCILIGGLGYFIFNTGNNWSLRILYIGLVLMALHIVFAKKYIIHDKNLLIKIAGFRTQNIPIERIQKIERLESIVDKSLSLKRLVLIYNTNDDFDYIAPKKQQDFVKALLHINPEIKVSSQFKSAEQENASKGRN